jgi:hypothetical protein
MAFSAVTSTTPYDPTRRWFARAMGTVGLYRDLRCPGCQAPVLTEDEVRFFQSTGTPGLCATCWFAYMLQRAPSPMALSDEV